MNDGLSLAQARSERRVEPAPQEKRTALGLISACDALNHLQYGITSVIFPVLVTELGFGLLQLGFLSAISFAVDLSFESAFE